MYVPAVVTLGIWIVMQVVSQMGALGGESEGGGVAYAAHIGGFGRNDIKNFLQENNLRFPCKSQIILIPIFPEQNSTFRRIL